MRPHRRRLHKWQRPGGKRMAMRRARRQETERAPIERRRTTKKRHSNPAFGHRMDRSALVSPAVEACLEFLEAVSRVVIARMEVRHAAD